MWKVYKRTVPNGKVYIGVTKRTLEERMSGGYVNNRAFALDIVKYGKENIISEVLEECEDYDTAIEREWYYIDLYKDNCYNKVGNSKRTSCTVRSAQTTLHSHSSTENSPKSYHIKDYIVPLTTKPNNRHSCPISVYDLTGKYITTYPSSKVASKELGVLHSEIVSCCKGVKPDGKARYQTGGYIFRYAIDKLDEYPEIPVRCKKVSQYTLDGEYIRTFDSLKDAFLHTGASIGSIGHVCKGLYKSAGGFKWKYADESVSELAL